MPLDFLKAIMEMIFRLINMIFGTSLPTGGQSVPKAPEMPKKSESKEEAAAPALSGLTMEQKMAMCPIATIMAFAGTPKEKRSEIDLTKLPLLQCAWLNGCDEKTLAALSKMEPDKAMDFVLMATAKVKAGMTKHLPLG